MKGETVSLNRRLAPTRSRLQANLLDRPLVVLAAHVVLAAAIQVAPMIATLHLYATTFAAVAVGLSSRKPAPTIYAAAYVAGSEVLWRMRGALPLWEYGKYLVVLLAILAIAKTRRFQLRSLTGVFYLLLLLPSAMLTLNALGFSTALRKALSFNLSGPLVLAAAVTLLGSTSYRSLDWRRLLLFAAAPTVAIAGIAFFGIQASDQIVFRTEANFATSGGYGPNQVSTALGFGAVCTFLMALQNDRSVNPWLVLISGWLLVQAVITLSRGGVFTAVFAIAAILVHFATTKKTRATIGIASVAILVVLRIAMPLLNDWTGGVLEQRFQERNTSGRNQIADHELALFIEHPLMGVGPGMASVLRGELEGQKIASHTEISRLLAEHGALGILAFLLLFSTGVGVFFSTPTNLRRGWVAAFATWTVLTIAHSAMRIALPGFVLGLAFLNWTDDPEQT